MKSFTGGTAVEIFPQFYLLNSISAFWSTSHIFLWVSANRCLYLCRDTFALFKNSPRLAFLEQLDIATSVFERHVEEGIGGRHPFHRCHLVAPASISFIVREGVDLDFSLFVLIFRMIKVQSCYGARIGFPS